jgi:hypothetical protein
MYSGKIAVPPGGGGIRNCILIIHQGGEVHDYSQSAKIRSRGAPRDVRREGYKGLLHRGLYTIFFTTRYVKTFSNNYY